MAFRISESCFRMKPKEKICRSSFDKVYNLAWIYINRCFHNHMYMFGHNINYDYLNVMFKANIPNTTLNQVFIFGFAKHFVPILCARLDMPKSNSN